MLTVRCMWGRWPDVILPADIFARYHRMKGNEVLMVSGSDQHGTPVTIKAEAEGKTPQPGSGFLPSGISGYLAAVWHLF